MKYKYLFGPVPSRRLGVSLGIDLVPLKTCTLNCIYCECGQTTELTNVRKEYVPLDKVLEEIKDCLATSPHLDYITFSGSGEPTLHSGLEKVVSFLKDLYPQYKICLLTNGTLFSSTALCTAVKDFDLIIPSIDAASEKIFQEINRPHTEIKCKDMLSGLIKLRNSYNGTIMIEIFIVPGLNDTPEELKVIKEALNKIKPDRVQIGTLDRPGTESWVKAADEDKMKEIRDYLDPAELIGDFRCRETVSSFNSSLNEQIIQTINRRPCTIKDLIQITGSHQAEIQKYINHLLSSGTIEVDRKARGSFFKLKKVQ